MTDRPDLDNETRAAIDALTWRLRQRALAEPEDRVDDEMLAREYVLAMRLRGWRPTPARSAPAWAPKAGQGSPPERHADVLAEARQAAAEASAKLRGAERGADR